MANDIKNKNADVKTKKNDVKSVQNLIKNKELQKAVNNKNNSNNKKDNSSPEVEAENKQKKMIVTTASIGAGTTFVASNLALRKQKRKLKEAKKYHQNQQQDIKNNIKNSRETIKEARKEYKQELKDIKLSNKNKNKNSEIKTSPNNKRNDNSQVKAAKEKAKSKYQNTKKEAVNSIKKQAAKYSAEVKNIAKIKLNKNTLNAAIAIAVFAMFIFIIVVIVTMITSPLGIMFNDDDPEEGTHSLSTVVQTINTEFATKIKEIENTNPYDIVQISNDGCKYTISNWQDILAIWDIKYCDETEIAFITDDQIDNVRNVVKDMITVQHYMDTKKVIENNVEVEKRVLHINVEYKNIDEMATLYNFDEQKLNELKEFVVSDDYNSIFREVVNDVVDNGSPIIGTGTFIYPTISKTISAGYPNYKSGKYHGGVDFPVPLGSPVFAVDDGVVTTAIKKTTSYGYYITIDHGAGLTTLYAHNSELLVEEGQTVHKGDIIALSGSTGNSTGSHCHFEVRVNGNRVNPINYLK